MIRMSCGCNGPYPPYIPQGPCCDQAIPYAAPTLPQEESVGSQLVNLEANLFGPFTVSVTRGRGTWTGLCSAMSSITGYPRNSGEGLICYLIRVFSAYVNGQGNGYFTAYVNSQADLLAVPTVGGQVPVNGIIPVMNLVNPGQLAWVQLQTGGTSGFVPNDYNAVSNNVSYRQVL